MGKRGFLFCTHGQRMGFEAAAIPMNAMNRGKRALNGTLHRKEVLQGKSHSGHQRAFSNSRENVGFVFLYRGAYFLLYSPK
ncbi:MAG: hypothetical protein PHH70_05445 [Candidatus Gracilibacteria bacterium]|nr:hypothetical protein [Candidatus Gracilibacteria bacterium]